MNPILNTTDHFEWDLELWIHLKTKQLHFVRETDDLIMNWLNCADGVVHVVGSFVSDDYTHRHVRGPAPTERGLVTVEHNINDTKQHRLDDTVDQPNVHHVLDVTDGAAVASYGQLQHQLAETRISGRTRRFHALHFHVDLCHSADFHLRFLLPGPVEAAGKLSVGFRMVRLLIRVLFRPSSSSSRRWDPTTNRRRSDAHTAKSHVSSWLLSPSTSSVGFRIGFLRYFIAT